MVSFFVSLCILNWVAFAQEESTDTETILTLFPNNSCVVSGDGLQSGLVDGSYDVNGM